MYEPAYGLDTLLAVTRMDLATWQRWNDAGYFDRLCAMGPRMPGRTGLNEMAEIVVARAFAGEEPEPDKERWAVDFAAGLRETIDKLLFGGRTTAILVPDFDQVHGRPVTCWSLGDALRLVQAWHDAGAAAPAFRLFDLGRIVHDAKDDYDTWRLYQEAKARGRRRRPEGDR